MITLLLSGCATGPEARPDDWTLHVSITQPSPEVELAIEAVSYDNLARYPQAFIHARYHDLDRTQVRTAMASATVEKDRNVPLVALPALIVRVQNHSQQPLDFSQAKIEIKDDRGKVYRVLRATNELQGRVSREIQSNSPAIGDTPATMEQILNAVSKLPLLPSAVVPPGGDWQGFLVPELEAFDAGELGKQLAQIQRIDVTISVGDKQMQARVEPKRNDHGGASPTASAH